jgi:16S rRNA (cytidine1402-2'-O)-methyltransferase
MEIKGECTLVIGPGASTGEPSDLSRVLELLDQETASGGKPRAVAKRVAARVTGWTAKDVYEVQQRMRADK